jgi:1,2-phenylacetyl-CoA epoxidase PaaB subunit
MPQTTASSVGPHTFVRRPGRQSDRAVRASGIRNPPQIEKTNMSELRYPNESREYRDAREALLKEEQELVAKVKSVAAKAAHSLPAAN